MTTTALSGLLEYLRGTLTANNMRWVGEHLIEYANKEEAEQLRPHTMQEIDDMLDEAENAFLVPRSGKQGLLYAWPACVFHIGGANVYYGV